MHFTKKLGFEICQRRIAVMQIEAAVNPSMGACLKHPCFKNLSLHHRYPPQGLVAANTCTYKNVAASIIEFSCENGLLNVFEARTPKQAYMDVFTATFCRLFLQLDWPNLNKVRAWGTETP